MKSIQKFILVVVTITFSSSLIYVLSNYMLNDLNRSGKHLSQIFSKILIINSSIISNNISIKNNFSENISSFLKLNPTFNITQNNIKNNKAPKPKLKTNHEEYKLKGRRSVKHCNVYDIDCKLQQTQQPYKYCNLPKNININSKSNERTAFFNSLQIKNFNFQNSHKFSKAEIEELKIKRLKKPLACTETKRNHNFLNNLKIDLDTNNDWTPFINRCQMKIFKGNYDIFGMFHSSGMSFPYLFMHIFKCGGTTVEHTWLKMAAKHAIPRITRFQRWKWYKSQSSAFRMIRKEIRNKFVFSFIRPNILNRFLSSFFEIQKRNEHNDVQTYPMKKILRKMYAMNDLQVFLTALQHRMLCEWNMKLSSQKHEYFIKMADIYSNEHLPPQLFYLLKVNWDFFDLNYVGSMDNITNVLEILFEDYILGRNLKLDHNEITEFFGRFYDQQRDRHSHSVITNLKLNSFVFEVSDLDTWMIEAICELYWPDFLCLPIDIPKECNLTKMFVDHYGDHIEYDSCYH